MDPAVRPEDLCPEWADDVRMRALFGPLPSQAAQPEARAGRVRFWTDLIEALATRSDRCLLSTGELGRLLARAGRSPQCLGEVVEAGRATGIYAEPTAYLDQLEQQRQRTATKSSWGSWLVGLGSGVVRSVAASVLGGGGSNQNSEAEFLVISIVEKLVQKTLKLIDVSTAPPLLETCSARYLREPDLLTCLAAASPHSPSRDLLLRCLLCTGRLAKLTLGQTTVVFKLNRRQSADNFVTVDEVDRGVVQLHASLELLTAQAAATEQRIASEAAGVKEGLRTGSRMRARSCLQRKKRAERRLEELLRQQANLETVYEEILHAETNNQVFSAYESGLAAMKALLKGPESTTVEAAEATMAELAELLEEAGNLSETLATGPAAADEDDELEKELAQLLIEKEDEEKKDQEKKDQEKKKEDTALLDQLERLTVMNDQLEDELLAAGDLEPLIGRRGGGHAQSEASSKHGLDGAEMQQTRRLPAL